MYKIFFSSIFFDDVCKTNHTIATSSANGFLDFLLSRILLCLPFRCFLSLRVCSDTASSKQQKESVGSIMFNVRLLS